MLLQVRNLLRRLRGRPPYVSTVVSAEAVSGHLQFSVPLDPHGRHLVACTAGVSEIVGTTLIVRIPHPSPLSAALGLSPGDLVRITNARGEFNLTPP